MSKTHRPMVGVVCDVKMIGIHPFHTVGEKYMSALAYGSDVLPVILPPHEAGMDCPDDRPFFDFEEVFDRCDGLFLPGSASNMEPWRYGGEEIPDDPSIRDRQRDQTTLTLIEGALERDIPLFCVCRGFQELNVAFGGTLHQQVHLVDGKLDHRADSDKSRAEQYAPAHDISLADNGVLRSLVGVPTVKVNSIHEQAVDRLGERLVPEAWAPDGIIEAISVEDAKTFAIGVQWHPEWRFWEDAVSQALFGAFGKAVRTHAAEKNG